MCPAVLAFSFSYYHPHDAPDILFTFLLWKFSPIEGKMQIKVNQTKKKKTEGEISLFKWYQTTGV